MKRSILALAVMCPLSLGADAPVPLDIWELAENSLKFNVEAVIYQRGEGDEAVPTTPDVTLELYRDNFYKLSIISRAAEGHAFPHFLPGPPVHSPPPSTRATAGFGFYSNQSDTLRFDAHHVRLIADGEDLEDAIRRSNDARALNEYRLVLAFVNTFFLNLFNDLYAYRSGDRLVFLLPPHSDYAFAAGPGDAATGIVVWELERSRAPLLSSLTAVRATVVGDAVEGLTVEFARSIAGRPVHYAWAGVADEAGRVDLDIAILGRSGASGYYRARARDRTGSIVGRWDSIPLNADRRQVLELTLGGGARVVAVHRLNAAKGAAPSEAQAAIGLAPNFPNPFNGSTQIVYRLASPGPVRLEIFNALGQSVRTLVDRVQAAGRYQVRWDARNRRGAEVAGGVYLMRLVHPGGVDARRVLYLR